MSNKLICCTVVAIFANLAVSEGLFYYSVSSCLFFCLLCLFILLKKLDKRFGLCLLLVWLVFSFLRWQADEQNVTQINGVHHEQMVVLQGYIHTPIERDGDRVQFKLKAKTLSEHNEPLHIDEQIMVQLYLEEEQDIVIAENLKRGDYITITGKIKRPQEAQNFEQFDYRVYLKQNRIHWVIQVSGIQQLETMHKAIPLLYMLLRYTDQLKTKLYEPFSQLFEGEHAGYLAGLVFGMKSELDAQLFSSFSQLGLTHILAVSGLHVAVVVTCLLFIFKVIRLPRSLSYTLTIFFLPLYIILTGAEPSIIRAGIMGMIGLWLVKKQKLKNIHSILAIAALLMIGINPLVVYNIGFQLSFLVTYGLIIFTQPLRLALPKTPNKLFDLVAVTLSAQLSSFPLTLYYFNSFNPLSLLANLVLVPYISFVILPLATLTNIVGHFSISVAKPLALLTTYGNELSFYVIDFLNRWSSFNLIFETPSLGWIITWYIVLFICVKAWSQRKRAYNCIERYPLHLFRQQPYTVKTIVTTACLIVLIIFAYQPSAFDLNKEGRVSFISVGQGDSILIQTPMNKTILVDSGGQLPFTKKEEWAERKEPFDVGVDIILPILKKRGIKHIDIAVITHFDADHFPGFIKLMDEIKIKEVWLNGTYKEDEETMKLYTQLGHYDIPVHIVKEGDTFNIDDSTTVEVLLPKPAIKFEEIDQNEQSIVLYLTMYDSTFLLTGDIGQETEKQLVYTLYERHNEDDVVDVLKLAHHGSKYSTSPQLLSYFSPQLAVVSVGINNRYGHPHPTVIERLNQYQIPLLRTDLHGEVMFVVSKNQLKLQLW